MRYVTIARWALVLALFLPAMARAIPVLFVVSEVPGRTVHGDSYVLPMENAAHIAHARALIADGPAAGATIAFARIAQGADGINRDVLAAGEPLWSWHVTEFLGFGDVGAEVLDGWPTFVEQDVPGWIANTRGQIGFWSYTVTAELPVPEPSTYAMLAVGAVLVGLRRFLRARSMD